MTKSYFFIPAFGCQSGRTWRCLLALVIYFVCSLTSAEADIDASSEPAVLLERMSTSFHTMDYQGSFTLQQEGSVESFRVAHAVIDGKEYERLEYMDGDRREIIRRGDKLNCFNVGHRPVKFSQFQQNLKLGELVRTGIDSFYQFSVENGDRIAGRQTLTLSVSPKDTHRYGYKLSLDTETGLLLRTELIGDRDKVLERFQFVDITFNPTVSLAYFQADIQPDSRPGGTTRLDVDSELIPAWTVGWLPAGYAEVELGEGDTANDMLSFTDGLSVFSVFLEPEDKSVSGRDVGEGNAQRGATAAVSKTVMLSGHAHRVTVVGEIPLPTAQQIAHSVTLSADG